MLKTYGIALQLLEMRIQNNISFRRSGNEKQK